MFGEKLQTLNILELRKKGAAVDSRKALESRSDIFILDIFFLTFPKKNALEKNGTLPWIPNLDKNWEMVLLKVTFPTHYNIHSVWKNICLLGEYP